jgi:zinc protease
VLQDMFLRPAYPDIDSERQVVIEEIAMYEDEPSDKVHDVLAGAIFGDHPLGRPIIGTADVVGSVPVPTVAAWHDGRYVPGNIVVAAAGNLEHERIVSLVEGAVGDPAPLPVGAASPQLRGPVLRFHEKETEQYHLCLGGPGIPRGDERRFALRILDTILGGSTSSRLFQEVREKRGLAYSVGTSLVSYRSASMTWGYTATKNERVVEALDVITDEMANLTSEGPSDEELQKAKDYLIGSYALGFDTSTKIAHTLAQISFEGLGIDYIARRNGLVAAVTQSDIRTAAERIFGDGRMLTVIAGRPTGV